MLCGVYTITNTVSGRVYVGQSTNISKRWYEHKYHLLLGTHKNPILQASWNKHGSNAFEFKIHTLTTVSELSKVEQQVLDQQPLDLRYNLGKCVKAPMLGRPHSRKTRENWSRVRKGKPSSNRAIEARNKTLKSKAHRTKTSRKYGGSAVRRIDPTGRIPDAIYESVPMAADAGFSRSCIYRVLRGGAKTHGGFIWERFGEKPTSDPGIINAVENSRSEEARVRRSRSQGGTPIIGVHILSKNTVYFEYIAQARVAGFSPSGISHALSGRRKTYRGYTWERA